jgi:hypothetical protein
MPYLLKGALIEYGSDFLGPIPNVVIFQFNPESLSRTIEIPPRPTGATSRETSQAGDIPVERVSLTAHFSAADQLKDSNPLAVAFGIGPRLAALEKISGLIGAALDAIGDAISAGEENACQPIPREQYPRILFIWGLTRVVPVIINSMTINEKEYDNLLNPVRAEVSLGLTMVEQGYCSEDKIAKGALEYSNLAKDAQAVANLANTIADVIDLIPI